MAYLNKPDLYASLPSLEVNGVLLSAKDYTAEYYKDETYAEDKKITKQSKLEIPKDQDSATVYVRITGKGNYTGTVDTSYTVHKTKEAVYDISKARVTIYGPGYDPLSNKNKKLTSVPFTGEPIEFSDPKTGTVVVEYKLDGKKYTKLEYEKDYTLSYANNVHKGKATLTVWGCNTENTIVEGEAPRRFIGNTKTQFSIGTKNIADLWDALKQAVGL